MFGKKGMSPLIATILLIAFAISLGAMIMNWQTDLSGDVEAVSICDRVSFRVHQLGNNPSYCFDAVNNELKFVLINKGKVQIDAVQYTVVDEDLNVDDVELSDSVIPVGKIWKYQISFTNDPMESSVALVPVADGEVCADKIISLDSIPNCS